MIEKKIEEFNSTMGNDIDEKISFSSILSVVLIFAAAGYIIFSAMRSIDFDLSPIEIFNTVFTSILMQAFPFILIGLLVSSVMHVFVPDEWIVKIFRKKYGLGFLTAMFAGIFFPVCECAIVPVMTGLVKKGVPMPIAVTFMLSAPIINPIVIISTLYAFPGQPEIMFMRVGFGLLIALMVGLTMTAFGNSISMLTDESECNCHPSDVGRHTHVGCACHCHHNEEHDKEGILEKFKDLFLHAGEEFFTVGKYLILGAFMTSLIQILIPKEVFVQLGMKSGLSLLVMMAVAFLFSACSTSDAFIARSFTNNFSMGSIMGFLVFGPMMDVKNLLMLLANFRRSFVIKLSLLILILNFIVLKFLTILFF